MSSYFCGGYPLTSRIISPLLGGALSNPAEKIPRLFKDTPFAWYPYLLPCSVVAGTILTTVLIGAYCLKEVRSIVI